MAQSVPQEENFEELLSEFFETQAIAEGSILRGTILGIQNDFVLIDVGLKSEGRIPLKEFMVGEQLPDLQVGGVVEVFLERMEGRNGEILLSREKAKRESAWKELETYLETGEPVEGVISGRVKGGFTVDLSGAVAFLPGSQVDLRPIRDVTPLMGIKQPFKVLKMDRARSNIVVSRRALMEGVNGDDSLGIGVLLEEGQVVEGVVKNILDYGAFVDLGAAGDGLLHVTDCAYRRIRHPEDILSVGDTITVKIIKFSPESRRISLGLKQLAPDPWDSVAGEFEVGQRYKGRVTNLTDYGAFVEIKAGVEGLVHVSQMGWGKKNISPGKLVAISQEVEVMILDVDVARRRVSLGLKQCLENPWDKIRQEYPVGSEFEGEIKNITEFGLFVGITTDVDGMVHFSDLSWERSAEEALAQYRQGDMIRVKVLDVEPEKERISLGVKQLVADPYAEHFASLNPGDVVECDVVAILDTGVEVALVESGLSGFIRKSELSRDLTQQHLGNLKVGQRLEAKVVAVDRGSRRVSLTIKGLEIDEDAHAVSYLKSSSAVGTSIGDIAGAAISQANEKKKSESADSSGDA